MSLFIPFSSHRRAIVASKIKLLHDSAIPDLKTINNIYASSCVEARADVTQLLKSAQEDRALLWVKRVIMKHNYLDVLFMIRGYCDALKQRMEFLISGRQLPDELKEVVASLLYAAPRCAEFPQLQEIAKIFIKHFGKKSVASISELRSSCAVNLIMLKKLSFKQPSQENRLMMIQEIGKGIGMEMKITKCLDEGDSFEVVEASSIMNKKQFDSVNNFMGAFGPGTMNHQESYTDIMDAAKCASEAAAHAAHVARIAVQLMKAKPLDCSRDYISNGGNSEPMSLLNYQSPNSENPSFGSSTCNGLFKW